MPSTSIPSCCRAGARKSAMASSGPAVTGRPAVAPAREIKESFLHSVKSDVVHGMTLTHDADLIRLLRSYIPYSNGMRLPRESATRHRSTLRLERRDPTG